MMKRIVSTDPDPDILDFSRLYNRIFLGIYPVCSAGSAESGGQ